jgi:hypothetical protein
VKLQLGCLHLVKGVVARECRLLWALIGNLQPRGVALPLRAGPGLLDSVPDGVLEGVFGRQLVLIDLHKLSSLDEHLGELVLEDVLVGDECRRLRRAAS